MPQDTKTLRAAKSLVLEAHHRAQDLRRTVEETREQIEESRRLLDSYQPPASLNNLIAAPDATTKDGGDQQD